MYLKITTDKDIYYINTQAELFEQNIIDDLGIKTMSDVVAQFECNTDGDHDYMHDDSEYDYNDSYVISTLTQKATINLVEVFEAIFKNSIVTEITKEEYDDTENRDELTYRCALTADLFSAIQEGEVR